MGKKKTNMTLAEQEEIVKLALDGHAIALIDFGADMYQDGFRIGKRYASCWWILALSLAGYAGYCWFKDTKDEVASKFKKSEISKELDEIREELEE